MVFRLSNAMEVVMTKKFLFISLLLLVSFLILIGVGPVSADSPWTAKYWNNKTMSGDPVLVRQESEINYDWGTSAPPGVAENQFSARWTKTLNVPQGDYRFTATMDDGMRVWVDNAPDSRFLVRQPGPFTRRPTFSCPRVTIR